MGPLAWVESSLSQKCNVRSGVNSGAHLAVRGCDANVIWSEIIRGVIKGRDSVGELPIAQGDVGHDRLNRLIREMKSNLATLVASAACLLPGKMIGAMHTDGN